MYAYNADVFCDDCGHAIIQELRGGQEDTGDSNEYPQYAHNDESDCPQHCADCHEFLENALTTDGIDYVKDAIMCDIETGSSDSIACTVWGPYYGIEVDNPNTGELAGMQCPECKGFGDFAIQATCTAIVDDGGVYNSFDYSWDDDSACCCEKCEYTACVGDFVQ